MDLELVTAREAAKRDGISKYLIEEMDKTYERLSSELVKPEGFTPSCTVAAGGLVVRQWSLYALSYSNGDKTRKPIPYRLSSSIALVVVNGKTLPEFKWVILI